MSEQFKFAFYILCSLLLTVQVNCAPTDEKTTPDTLETEPDTAPPTYDVNEVLDIEHGTYTTVGFHYEVNQMKQYKESEYCYDDYIKCLMSHTAPMPVCAFYSTHHYKVVNSFCEVYFENCRIKYRYWRIVGFGRCHIFPAGYPALYDYH